MKVILLAAVMFLTACTSAPVKPPFPEVPERMMEKPKPLKQIPRSTPTSSLVFETIIENYGAYHDVSARLDSWQKWYVEQKKIYDAAD